MCGFQCRSDFEVKTDGQAEPFQEKAADDVPQAGQDHPPEDVLRRCRTKKPM